MSNLKIIEVYNLRERGVRVSARKVHIVARGRNTERAIDVALWLKMNSDFKIADVNLRTVARKMTEDPN